MSAHTKSGPRIDKRQRFYFLHGDDEAAIERTKHEIIEAHLDAAGRAENYSEIIPSGSPPSLKKVLGDLMAELSTISFLPDVTRVVTMYTVNDFFEARPVKGRAKKADSAAAPKKSPSEHLAEFLRTELPKLPAVLIVIAVEDYEKWKRVASANPVVEFAREVGAVRAFKEESPQFAFFDALFARQGTKALTLWREWLRRTGSSPRPYMQLASQVRLLIEAKTASSGQLQQRGITKQRYAQEFMPAEADRNLFALRPEWRQEKLLRAASNFSFNELLTAYEELMPLQKYAIPMHTDVYVPDKVMLSELWILKFAGQRE